MYLIIALHLEVVNSWPNNKFAYDGPSLLDHLCPTLQGLPNVRGGGWGAVEIRQISIILFQILDVIQFSVLWNIVAVVQYNTAKYQNHDCATRLNSLKSKTRS